MATLVLYRATLTAGSGNDITPSGGNVASFALSSQNMEFEIRSGAVRGHKSQTTHMPLRLIQNKLVIRSKPSNATPDHDISTMLTIVEGAI